MKKLDLLIFCGLCQQMGGKFYSGHKMVFKSEDAEIARQLIMEKYPTALLNIEHYPTSQKSTLEFKLP